MRHLSFKSKFKGKEYTVDLPLRSQITVIADQSGTGKTLMMKMAVRSCEYAVGYNASDIKSLEAIIYWGDNKIGVNNGVVIIDNADKLIRDIPDIESTIKYDSTNHYILLMRKEAPNIEIDSTNYARLAFDPETNTFGLSYFFDERV